MAGVMAVMVTSFRRTYASMPCFPGLLQSVSLTLWQATVDSRLCQRLLDTHRKSGSVSCGVTVPFSWVLVCTGFVVPAKSLFPQSCGSSVIRSHWTSKSNSLGVLSPFAGSPDWEICC